MLWMDAHNYAGVRYQETAKAECKVDAHWTLAAYLPNHRSAKNEKVNCEEEFVKVCGAA